ncbi:cyd operon YbgE family protein [Halomonas sp. YLGW01]|uniref:cyd operon YbgE family protein n=1 Tax=Halomonas sp. YLGW01 TaxID=2773308 RepID=UPI001A91C723|nr:cyd operon YbgE family protein [Halomonas sp. YLGW01]
MHRIQDVWLPFGGLLLSSLLAVALLWRPETLSDLAWGWRLPLVVLGSWALGAGFMHGLGLVVTRPWGRRLLAAPLCWWGLAGFALFVAGRWILG